MGASAQGEAHDTIKSAVNDPDAVYNQTWGAANFPQLKRNNGVKVTPVRQEVLADEIVQDQFEHFWARRMALLADELAPEDTREKFTPFIEGMKSLEERKREEHGIETRAMDDGVLSGTGGTTIVPLVFDPEILAILKQEAPFVEWLPEEGQQGFAAVFNRIDSRDSAIGFTTESDVMNLTDNTASDIGFTRDDVDMEIWADLVQISDFSAMASEHYMNVRDTTLGERVANHAQAKARAVLYGGYNDTGPTSTGDFLDSDAYDGLAEIIRDAGNETSKTSTDISGTDGLLKDIKSEIKDLLQGSNNVNKSDLTVWTSHTVFDHLENELGVHRTIVDDPNSVNFGFERIQISQVDVFATHNIDQHTDDGNNIGSEGDVFIINRREARFRSLMPLSTVPLGRRGFSDEVAMGEFGAPIMRGGGNLSKYLSDYQV